MGTPKPEAFARKEIDRQLEAAGWIIQDRRAVNLHAGSGVAVREFPLASGPVDYLLYVDGAAARRAAHYRNPGPSQRTNIRLNERFRTHLATGGRIKMAILTSAEAEINGRKVPLDLTQ